MASDPSTCPDPTTDCGSSTIAKELAALREVAASMGTSLKGWEVMCRVIVHSADLCLSLLSEQFQKNPPPSSSLAGTSPWLSALGTGCDGSHHATIQQADQAGEFGSHSDALTEADMAVLHGPLIETQHRKP